MRIQEHLGKVVHDKSMQFGAMLNNQLSGKDQRKEKHREEGITEKRIQDQM